MHGATMPSRMHSAAAASAALRQLQKQEGVV
jgi:hypothetical protein